MALDFLVFLKKNFCALHHFSLNVFNSFNCLFVLRNFIKNAIKKDL